MSKIHVLALNDDNHSKCYVTRGSYYHDIADFARNCLLKSHTCDYEVRDIYLCDPPAALSNIDEDDFLTMFDALACEYHPETLFQRDLAAWTAREHVFDLFWKYGDEWRYA